MIFEGFLKADAEEKYPVCVGGKYAGPPEDVGGPPGFEEFKAAIADKNHERHQEFLDWYDGDYFHKKFDVNFFKIDLTNFRIARREKPRLIKAVKTKAAGEKGNPTIDTLASILKTMGFKLTLTPIKKAS